MAISVELHDLTFRRFINQGAIEGRISTLAVELTALLNAAPSLGSDQVPLMLGILNGAVMFHSDLIRACDFQLEVAYLRTRSYVGTSSTGKVTIDWPADLDLTGRHVVIVEDIVDSGLTLSTLTEQLRTQQGVAGLTTVVLLDKPSARTTAFTPDLVGFSIEDAFVVGYGLDYNGLGRNLPSIYQVVD